MSRMRFSVHRTCVIASNTWLEAVRQRFFNLLLVVAVAVVFSGLFFREFNFGMSELKFIADFGFGALTLFGSILAIVGTAQLYFSEIDHRTVHTVLAKPVLRSEFLVGKYLGAAAVILVFVAILTLAIGGTLWWREGGLLAGAVEPQGAERLVAYGAFVPFGVMQALKLCVAAGSTLLIATYSRTLLFTVTLSFLVLVICHLQPFAQAVWSRSDTWPTRLAGGAFAILFPNFQLFDLGAQIADGRGISIAAALPILLYALIYIAALLALAVFSFRRREI